MYTSHGQQIPGTPRAGKKPNRITRCGGVRVCSQCQLEAASHFQMNPEDWKNLIAIIGSTFEQMGACIQHIATTLQNATAQLMTMIPPNEETQTPQLDKEQP